MKDIIVALIGAAGTILAAYITVNGGIGRHSEPQDPPAPPRKKTAGRTSEKTTQNAVGAPCLEIPEEQHWEIEEKIERLRSGKRTECQNAETRNSKRKNNENSLISWVNAPSSISQALNESRTTAGMDAEAHYESVGLNRYGFSLDDFNDGRNNG